MKRIQTALAALCLFGPGQATAQDFSITTGATLTSRYIYNGLPLSNAPAFQPFVELEASGVYAGLWASNTSLALTGARGELNLYLGYRNELGQLSYDVGYTRFITLAPRDNCCGEAHMELGYAFSDMFSTGARLAYDPSSKTLNSSAMLGVAPIENLSLDATLGNINRGGHRYWSAGGSYAFGDGVSASAAWHDTNIDKGRAVFSLDYSFNIR